MKSFIPEAKGEDNHKGFEHLDEPPITEEELAALNMVQMLSKYRQVTSTILHFNMVK